MTPFGNRALITLLWLGMAVLPAFAWSQEAEDTVEAEVDAEQEPDNRSVYETLVFDQPVPLTGLTEPPPEATFEGAPEADNGTTSLNELALDRALDIERFEDSIATIEIEGGVWDLGLSESLMALGEALEEQGAYREAADAYSRAMHVSRVNLGLDSLDHVPIVERMIGSYLALGDWERADQYQDYLFYAESRVYGLDDPRMIRVLDRMAHWNLSVFNARWGPDVGLRLANAFYMYRRASNLVSTYYGEQDDLFVKFLRDSAGTAFLVARYQPLISEVPQPQFREAQLRFTNQATGFRPDYREGYAEGLGALQQVVTHFQQTRPGSADYALALIHEGDWYLLFDRPRTAEERYAQAHSVLSPLENGEELIREYLGVPTPLPAFSEQLDTIFIAGNVASRETNARKVGYVDASFSVTSYGAVTDLEILTGETEVDNRVLSALRRKIRGTVFRPVVQDGVAIRTAQNLFRYRFLY